MDKAPKQKRERERIGKRKNPKTKAKTAFSQNIKQARELIAGDDSADGLKKLNTLAASTKNPIKRAKILLTIAESETRLSRHTEALAAFQKASQYAAQAADPDLTLLSGTGIVRSLLRSLRTDEAKTAAKTLLTDLTTAEAAFEKLQNLTPEQLAAQGSIVVPGRPPRATVGLTKIANAFMESGQTEEARAFLLKAIQISPNGASRARQVLAKIALASDKPELAERYARESLLMGRFQAKTTAAWQLYLDARARQNLIPILEPDVFASFQQHAKGRIAAASSLSIARVLRAHGDPTWKTIATAQLAKKGDPIITTEIEKLLHADAKLFATEEPRVIAARALKLARSADASLQETIAHAKEYVRYSLAGNINPNLERVITIASKKFPPVAILSIRHAAALGAMMASQHDLARQWLFALMDEATQLEEITAWGKATWALARMESLLEKNAEAAYWYMEIAANPETPPRFKIQAMLRGLKFLGKSGDNSTDISKLTRNIRAILRQTDDFHILLDAARQLALAGGNFTVLTGEATEIGIRLAKKRAEQSTSGTEKLKIYEYLSRKLHCDLVGQNKRVVSIWKNHTELERAEFKTAGGSVWYEYVRTVLLAMLAEGNHDEASALASGIVDGSASTPEGYVIVGSAYAEWQIQVGKTDKAFDFFDWIVRELPTHRRAASSHYWLALKKFKVGELAGSKICANAARKCFAGRPSLLLDWEIEIKTIFLIWVIDCLLLTSVYPPIPQNQENAKLLLEDDLAKLNP